MPNDVAPVFATLSPSRVEGSSRKNRKVKPPEIRDPETDQFRPLSAGKFLIKGVFRPVVTMGKHPIASVAAVAGTIVLGSVAPVTVPLMVLGGLAFGGVQTAKGISTAITQYKQRHFAEAEQAFEAIGEGAFTAGTSAMGVKTGGMIAAESGATTTALTLATTAEQRLQAVDEGLVAAAKVSGGSWGQALKSTGELLTTAEGRGALAYQLNPKALGNNLKAYGQGVAALFKDPPVVDVVALTKEVQAHLGIADKDMPALALVDGKETKLMSMSIAEYDMKSHTITLAPKPRLVVKDMFDSWATTYSWILPKDSLQIRMLNGMSKVVEDIDQWPKPVVNLIDNSLERLFPLRNLAAHELQHSVQFKKATPLSKEQLGPLVDEMVEQGMSRVSAPDLQKVLDLTGKTKAVFTEEAKAVSRSVFEQQIPLSPDPATGKTLEEASQAFKAIYRGIGANGYRAKDPLNGTRPYIETPIEVEARQTGAQFAAKEAIAAYGEQTPDSLFNRHLWGQVRNCQHETQLNQQLSQMDRLREANQPVEAQEKVLQAWEALPGTRSSTKMMLKEERNQRTGHELGTQVKTAVEAIKQAVNPKKAESLGDGITLPPMDMPSDPSTGPISAKS